MSILKAIFFSTLLGLGMTSALAEKPAEVKKEEVKKCEKCKKDHSKCDGSHGKCGKGSCKMKGHHGMGMGEMTATSDGGVVVKIGNTLYKYDKDLKLVGQTEIPFDFKKMHEKMKKQHGEMKGMGPGKGKPDSEKSKK